MMKRKFIHIVWIFSLPAMIWSTQDSNMLVDNFDGNEPRIGRTWVINSDKNKLGTKVNPFGIEKTSAKSETGNHGHFYGHVGRNMDPWPFALVELSINQNGPNDLSAFKAIRFYAKGDGKTYRVSLGRKAAKDHCHFQYSFTTNKDWTVFVCPLDEFAQPEWGVQIEKGFKDVISVRFEAPSGGDDEDFDLHFDDVEFLTTIPVLKKE